MSKPASPKQIAFIGSLLSERDHGLDTDRLPSPQDMTSREASDLISGLLKKPKKPRTCSKCGATLNGRFCDSCKGLGPVEVAEGWYTKDSMIAKVQRAVHGSGNLYAKRLVIEEYTHLDADGPGVNADWVYERGLIVKIAREGWTRLTLEEAERFGRLYGICGCCGATLTNEESIERGIGPVCAGRLAGV